MFDSLKSKCGECFCQGNKDSQVKFRNINKTKKGIQVLKPEITIKQVRLKTKNFTVLNTSFPSKQLQYQNGITGCLNNHIGAEQQKNQQGLKMSLIQTSRKKDENTILEQHRPRNSNLYQPLLITPNQRITFNQNKDDKVNRSTRPNTNNNVPILQKKNFNDHLVASKAFSPKQFVNYDQREYPIQPIQPTVNKFNLSSQQNSASSKYKRQKIKEIKTLQFQSIEKKNIGYAIVNKIRQGKYQFALCIQNNTKCIFLLEQFPLDQIQQKLKQLHKLINFIEIDHPNLRDVYHIFKKENKLQIIHEYCQQNLLEFTTGVNLKISEIKQLVKQIIAGLIFLHQNAISHGNLSLISVYVVFGIAKIGFSLKSVCYNNKSFQTDIEELIILIYQLSFEKFNMKTQDYEQMSKQKNRNNYLNMIFQVSTKNCKKEIVGLIYSFILNLFKVAKNSKLTEKECFQHPFMANDIF